MIFNCLDPYDNCHKNQTLKIKTSFKSIKKNSNLINSLLNQLILFKLNKIFLNSINQF